MRHIPVLVEEVVESLQLRSGMIIVDCTLGDGGHSERILQKNKINKADGILMDFGWSSPQFSERGRVFSFNLDEVLDMRYDAKNDGKTAKDIVNNYSEKDLEILLRKYGEEKNSKRIALEIVKKRKTKEIVTTNDLVEIVMKINKKGKAKIHPATRVFQAIRMEVNNELEVIKKVLPDAVESLSVGGRLAIITFHSLEDSIVKHYFKSQSD